MNDAHASLKRETAADGMSGGREQKLPLRDWILLPVLGLLTICVVAFSAEAIAWRTFPESASSVRDCYRSGGVGAIPNSVCWEKVPEGELTEFKFNSCGDRAGMECGPKPPETLRIVMVGSSFAMGLYTARERTFAALLPTELSRQTRHKIELYNEGILGGAPPLISQNFNRALAAKPDLILWILTPWDMGNTAFELNGNAPLRSPEPAGKKGSMAWTLHRLKFAVTTNSIYNTALDRWHQDKLNLLLRHFLYESQTLYLQSYMKGSMRTLAGFLYTEPDAEWRDHLRGTDIYASDIEERSRVAGVPVVAVLIPNRAQAAMLSMDEWPAGYDPYKLGEEVRAIVTSHGGTYIDILPDFRNIPNSERYYMPVDGHPNADWHAMISEMLVKELTSGAVPALRVAAQPQAAQEHER